MAVAPHRVRRHRRFGVQHSYGFDLWTGARRAEHEVRLRGQSDSENTVWFVAPSVEELALETEDGFHWLSFGLRVGTKRVGLRCCAAVD